MNRLPYSLCALLAAGAIVGSSILQAADAPPDSGAANINAIQQLKPGKGRELVLANCMPCHSSAVIAASHQTREKWDMTITKMQKQNGMWPILPSVRSKLLDYLEATQPPSDPGLEKAKETAWAAPLYRPNPIW